jgi:hypothetical protein
MLVKRGEKYKILKDRLVSMRASTEEIAFLKNLGLTHTKLFRHAMRVLKQRAADLTLDKELTCSGKWIPKSKIKIDSKWKDKNRTYTVESFVIDEDDDICDIQCVDESGEVFWLNRGEFNQLKQIL